MSGATVVIGIDVSKARLDVAQLPDAETWSVPNDGASIRAAVARLATLAPHLIVLEATGGYERAVVAALAAAQLPVVVVNPRQIRTFARAIGLLAKTDRSMPDCWPASASKYSLCRDRCRTRRPRRSMPCSPGGGN